MLLLRSTRPLVSYIHVTIPCSRARRPSNPPASDIRNVYVSSVLYSSSSYAARGGASRKPWRAAQQQQRRPTTDETTPRSPRPVARWAPRLVASSSSRGLQLCFGWSLVLLQFRVCCRQVSPRASIARLLFIIGSCAVFQVLVVCFLLACDPPRTNISKNGKKQPKMVISFAKKSSLSFGFGFKIYM